MSTINYYSAFILSDLDEPFEPNDRGVYELAHATLYKVRMINHHSRLRCDATVLIDGKNIGSYRISPSSMFTLERTAEVKKRLTFYKVDSDQGREAGLNGNNPDLGEVKIIFAQEKSFTNRELTFDEVDSSDYICKGVSLDTPKGGTGLSQASTQRFREVPDLPISEKFTMTLTLTLKESGVEPLR